MQITLLGTGSPLFDPDRQQSALLIDVGGQKTLVDAGRGVFIQMMKAGVQPQQVDSVFITHHHHDHIGGLGDFLMGIWNNGGETPLNVTGPHGAAGIVTCLLDQVFSRDIAFALFTEEDAVDIRDLVSVAEVGPGWAADVSQCRVSAERVEHGHGLGLSYEEFPCLGYRFEAEGKVVAVSGDTVDCEGLDRLARGADVLVQCCYRAEAEITTPAEQRQAQYVIASSGQVGKIAARCGVKKLVLTHFRPKSDAMMSSLADDVRKDYSGDLVIGRDLMTVDV